MSAAQPSPAQSGVPGGVLLDPDRTRLVTAAVAAGADPYQVRATAMAGAWKAVERLAGRPGAVSVPATGFVLLGGMAPYPRALGAGTAPPPLLFGVGDPAALAEPGVCVHGSPAGDSSAAEVAAAAASAAAHEGASVVCGASAGSGLVAAQSAIQFQTPVVYVVPAGPDVPATRAGADLARDVAAAGGAVVSEFPFGSTATAGAYRSRVGQRHRIVSGLSSVLVPTDGELPSDAAAAVWSMLAAGRPVVVLAPADAAGSRQLPFALSRGEVVAVDTLRQAGCPASVAARLADRAPVANAVADDLEQLTLAVSVLVQLDLFHGPYAGPGADAS